MNYKDVLNNLKNNTLDNLYLFYGPEFYLIEKTINTLKEKMIDHGFEELNYQIMDGKETRVDEIINACETLPFMGEKRMVVVKDLECFFSKRKNFSEEDEENLNKYFKDIPSTTYLFFIVTEGIDKRKKIVKSIQKHGNVVEFEKLTGKDIFRWIGKAFGKLNKEIGERDATHFLEITGYLDKNSTKSLNDLENEINKLSNYVGDRALITTEDIDLLAPKSIENNIFTLVEAIGAKNGDKALTLLNDMLLEGEPEIRILFMITRQFRLLFQIRLMEQQGYTPMAMGPKLGLQQFVVKKSVKQAMNFELDVLRGALEQCLYTDESIKKGRIDQRLGIELLIGRFAQ